MLLLFSRTLSEEAKVYFMRARRQKEKKIEKKKQNIHHQRLQRAVSTNHYWCVQFADMNG